MLFEIPRKVIQARITERLRYIIKNGELSRLFIIKFLEPVFACLIGALILNEDIFKIQYLIAFILISGSIWISNKKTSS